MTTRRARTVLAALLCAGVAVAAEPPVRVAPPPRPAAPPLVEDGWFLLVEDLDCTGCRAEVFLHGRLIALQPSGTPNTVVRLDALLRPGENELLFFVRGPEGPGKMAINVARGRVVDGVIAFDPDPTRYALHPAPAPQPLRVRIDPQG